MHLVLFIVNKHGSLVYSKVFSSQLTNFDSNSLITSASSFHSMHAISAQVTPQSLVGKNADTGLLDGITELVADTFVLKSLQTQTGVKMIVASEVANAPAQNDFLQKVNQAYADFVSKNPYQEAEQPIKSNLYD